MNLQEYVSKSHLEQKQFLRFLSREQKAIFLKEMAQNAGEGMPVKLSHILSLDPADRVQITPELLAREPLFKLEITQTLYLEARSSGGGPKQQDRIWQVYEPGVYTVSYKRAALLMDLYGPDAELENQRGRCREWTEEPQAKTAKKN